MFVRFLELYIYSVFFFFHPVASCTTSRFVQPKVFWFSYAFMSPVAMRLKNRVRMVREIGPTPGFILFFIPNSSIPRIKGE